MNLLDYLQIQLRLEGKEISNDNLLRQVEVLPDEDMPLMVIAQLADSNVVAYFDEALPLPAELCEELWKQVSRIRFPNIGPLSAFLPGQNITFEVGHYKTYLFPEGYSSLKDATVGCFSRHDPRIQEFGFDRFAEQGYGIERNGKVVSACVSVRENEFCGEAWVYTDPEYRRNGLAQKVVAAWATKLIASGKVPFYSHKIENMASTNLAKRLGLQPVFEEIVISYSNV
jgi:GNAT superfamily N-acetyltransferase